VAATAAASVGSVRDAFEEGNLHRSNNQVGW
jgi:hypothetical protein